MAAWWIASGSSHPFSFAGGGPSKNLDRPGTVNGRPGSFTAPIRSDSTAATTDVRVRFVEGNAVRQRTHLLRSGSAEVSAALVCSGESPPANRCHRNDCRTLFPNEKTYETDSAALARGLCSAADAERRHPAWRTETLQRSGDATHTSPRANENRSPRFSDAEQSPRPTNGWRAGKTPPSRVLERPFLGRVPHRTKATPGSRKPRPCGCLGEQHPMAKPMREVPSGAHFLNLFQGSGW